MTAAPRPPVDPTLGELACTSEADDDRALVARYRQGDRQAFSQLVARYQRPIYQAAYWVLHRAEDASDIAQTVFLKAAEHIDDYDPRFKFFSWIYRIAVNEALNARRRRAHEREQDPDEPEAADDEPAGPEWRASQAERARRVQSAMRSLSPMDRLVLTMRHFHDCSYAEMAEALSIEEKTVKSRLFDARQRLKAQLGDLEGSGHGRH